MGDYNNKHCLDRVARNSHWLINLWNLEVLSLFYGGRKTGEPREKPSQQEENQQQSQPTRDGEYGNRTRVTEVRSERSSTAPTMLQGIELQKKLYAASVGK